jgi:hypothetical protein
MPKSMMGLMSNGIPMLTMRLKLMVHSTGMPKSTLERTSMAEAKVVQMTILNLMSKMN